MLLPCCSLRDELLDAAREVADDDEEAAEKMSLGEALLQALDKRLGKPAAAAAIGSSDAVANGDMKPATAEEADAKEPQAKQEGDKQQQQQQPDTEAADTSGDAAGDTAAVAEPKVKPKPEPTEQPEKDKADQATVQANGSTAAAAADAAEAVKGAASENAATAAAGKATSYTAEQLELLDWHWANLEYGCSASLTEVSLPHWNQVRHCRGCTACCPVVDCLRFSRAVADAVPAAASTCNVLTACSTGLWRRAACHVVPYAS